jgi:MFS family permease
MGDAEGEPIFFLQAQLNRRNPMAAAASTPHSVPVSTRESATTHIADRASYWLISAGIYLTFGLLFYYSAKEKLIDDSGTMPAGLAKTFHGTFVTSFPGTNASWVLIGLLEALVFVAIAASVLMGEFLPTRRKPILLSGLSLAMFTFAMIAWGENITAGFATVAELFQYLVGTAVLIVLVLLMPPYRKTQWLSGLLRHEQ